MAPHMYRADDGIGLEQHTCGAAFACSFELPLFVPIPLIMLLPTPVRAGRNLMQVQLRLAISDDTSERLRAHGVNSLVCVRTA